MMPRLAEPLSFCYNFVQSILAGLWATLLAEPISAGEPIFRWRIFNIQIFNIHCPREPFGCYGCSGP